MKSIVNGPVPGTIIHGAPNWEGQQYTEEQFDIESIGVEDTLKPIPPAYGMYRGSVRIADSDIRYVFHSPPRLIT